MKSLLIGKVTPANGIEYKLFDLKDPAEAILEEYGDKVESPKLYKVSAHSDKKRKLDIREYKGSYNVTLFDGDDEAIILFEYYSDNEDKREYYSIEYKTDFYIPECLDPDWREMFDDEENYTLESLFCGHREAISREQAFDESGQPAFSEYLLTHKRTGIQQIVPQEEFEEWEEI